MEFDSGRSEAEKRAFRTGILALVLLFAVVVSLQIAGARTESTGGRAAESDRDIALRSGDLYAKFSLAWPSPEVDSSTKRAYNRALPLPGAYRRLGVLSVYWATSGRAYFERLDSAARKLHLSSKQIAALRREKAMWLTIFGRKPLPAEDLPSYVHQIRALDLGPLTDIAIYEVYRRAGLVERAERILDAARSGHRSAVAAATGLLGLLVIGGMVGLFVAVRFLVANAAPFSVAPHSRLNWSAGVSSFVAYLAGYIGLGAIVEIASDQLSENTAGAAYLGLLITSAVVAYAFGMWVLISHLQQMDVDWRDIGYRTIAAARDLLTGVAGFFAVIPFLVLAWLVTLMLGATVFRHIPTPEQPFQGIVARGGGLSLALTFIAASIVAPIVEETFFRGVLYTTLRGRMGVWAAAAISSGLFAIIHPLPGGFVPIFVLACAFALMRERTGSLLPSMACHSVYNTLQLVFVVLLF